MTRRRSPYPPEAPIAIFRGRHVEIAPFLDVITFPRTEEQGDVHGWLLDTPEGLAYAHELEPLTPAAVDVIEWVQS